MNDLYVEGMNVVDMDVQVDGDVQMSTDQTTRIIEAISPIVDVTRIEGGVKVTVIDKEGTKEATVNDGQKGDRGEKGETGEQGPAGEAGEPGVTPSFSIGTVQKGEEAGATITGTDEEPILNLTLPKGDPGEKGDTGDTGAAGADGVSPTVSVSPITGGHEVSITDATGTSTFDVMDGTDGDPGEGVPSGGTTGQFLRKKSGTNYDTEWAAVPDPTGKADKVSNATAGNFAGLDSSGNLTDSGHKHSDYLTQHQDISGKLDKPSTAGTNGQVLTSDGQGGQSWQTPSGGTVTDVQEDGTSILSSGVANILTMTGAGASAAGAKGLVPAPASGDQDKVLTGGGTWVQKTGANLPMSGTDSTPVKEAIEAIANVVTEIPLTITPSDWAASSPYSYTWTDSRVLADSSVEVEIQDSSAESGMLYLSYEKASGGGGIVFTPSSLPTANVAVLIVITNAQAHSGSSIDADTVATDAVSGAANVDEALTLHNEAIATLQGNRAKIKTFDLNSGASTTISGVQNGILAVTRGTTGLYGLFWGSGTSTLAGGSNLVVSLSNSNLTITNNAGMTCVCILIYN